MTTPAVPTALSVPSTQPWWRFPIVWMVIAGPLLVVVAGTVTAVIAWTHVDPVLEVAPQDITRSAETPAMQGRNKAAEISVQAPPEIKGKH